MIPTPVPRPGQRPRAWQPPIHGMGQRLPVAPRAPANRSTPAGHPSLRPAAPWPGPPAALSAVKRAPALGARPGPSQVRGAQPPGGPDTSAVRHTLYVKVPEAGDPDTASRATTLGVLKYVQALLPTFAHMGIEVKVNKVTTGALRNPKLRAAMRGRGIDKLPALLTANNVYLGRREIEDLYDRNLKEFKAFAQRGESIVEGMAGEDELESYYKSEMSQEALDEDDEEEGIGRSDVLMRKYNEAVAKRDRHRPQREKPVSRNLTALAPKEQRRARAGDAPPRAPSLAPRPAQHASERRGGDDDVPEREEPSGDESEIQDLIKRMSQDVGTDVAAKAFAGGGGDSLDGDEEGSDAQDKLMLAKYWGNMESSI